MLALVAAASAASGEADRTAASGAPAPVAAGTNDAAHAALLQPDGKIVALGGSDGRFALARYSSTGALDQSFGDGGRVLTDLDPNAVDDVLAAALEPDGKIVAAGSSGARLAVARYNADGSLDRSFATDGSFLAPCCTAAAVALPPDGRIVVGAADGNAFRLIRLNPDGSRDRSFGADGTVSTNLGHAAALGALALEPDGRIVAVGSSGPPDARAIDLTRYETDGSLDASFGSGGVVTTTPSAGASAGAVGVERDGAVIVAGSSAGDLLVARYESDGSPDPSFGAAGNVLVPGLASRPAEANALTLGSQTGITVGGGAGGALVLARLGVDGSLDPSFGTDGTVHAAVGGGPAFGPAAAVLGVGSAKSLTVGSARAAAACDPVCAGRSPADFALRRYDADGSLDASFGTGGTVLTDFGAPTQDPTGSDRPLALGPGAGRPGRGPRSAARGKTHRLGAPNPVPAFYINADNPNELKRFAASDACSYAKTQPKRAHRALILDFGGARAYGDGKFGAAVNNASFPATNAEIRAALKTAADAYAACHRRGQGKISYAVTNHFKDGASAAAGHQIGVHQAGTVRHLSKYQRKRGYYPAERAGVAGDIETGYWGPKYSRAMVNGAEKEWGQYLDFGTAGGCPPHHGLHLHGCFNDWTVAQVAHVSNAGGSHSLPEIYYRGGRLHFDQAAQWAHVARAWNSTHRTAYDFAGTTGSTEFSGLTPGESWKRMRNKAPGHVGRELLNFKQDQWLAKSASARASRAAR